jgi:hypothetical protein
MVIQMIMNMTTRAKPPILLALPTLRLRLLGYAIGLMLLWDFCSVDGYC